ncbi:MAG: hypothetical protein ACYTFA_01635, partial [Planctomycetota bacterium]
AYEYGETIALYPEHMKRLIVERRDALAWGIIPTSHAVGNESVESLVERFERLTDHLSQRAGIDKRVILEQAFITPSSGTGSMEVADAERVFELLAETSHALQERYGF